MTRPVLITCSHCGKTINKNNKRCPYCGKKINTNNMIWIVIVMIIGICLFALSSIL